MKKIYILLISLSFLACGNQEKNETTAEETVTDNNQIEISTQQFESENMQLGMLTEQPFNTVVKANGMIDVPPENKSSVSTFVGGYVTKIPLLVGDKVKKGQLVASLQNTDFVEIQQQYLEITEQLNFLKNEYDRQKTLFDEKITSQKSYLKAESTYKSSLALQNGLRKKLQMMNISPSSVEQGNITSTINLYAPINGYVTKVNVSNGSFVSSASELLEIVNTDHIHLELIVFEKDILNVKKEQTIQFKVPEASDEVYDAKVHLVGTSIAEDRTIKVHGHIHDENNTNFIVGMFVEANIITTAKNHLALPNEAIATIDGKSYTLILDSKKDDKYIFKKILLETGKTNETYTEVLNPDAIKGKDILIKGSFMLMAE